MDQKSPDSSVLGKWKALPWPQKITIIALIAASLSLLVFGGFASFLCLLMVALMGWTPSFVANAAQGRRTMGNSGRLTVGGIMTVLAVWMLPSAEKSDAEVQKSSPVAAVGKAKPALTAEQGKAMEKKNAAKIAQFIADVETLDKRDYEGRLTFWQQITAFAPLNAEYAQKRKELEQQVAELDHLKANPELGMEVEKVVWRKEGFGNVMVIDITLRNDSLSHLKDFQITCESNGPSGTMIDRNSRVLYEMVEARKTRTFRKINMGFINRQASGTQCGVDEASVA